MRDLKQSTARDVMVFMTSSSDHLTGLTGATLTITASKNGAAFSSITPTVTERGDGWYALSLTTSHTNTLGDFAIHVTATGADATDMLFQVVAYDPANATNLGLSNIDDTISSRSTLIQSDILSDATPFAGANLDASISSRSTLTQAQVLSDATPFAGANIDATISSRSTLTQAQVLSDATPFAGADVALIRAKTDNLPSGIKKNTALSNFEFLMIDSTDHISPKTGLTITSERSINGAAFGSCANSASELANGIYKINFATTDLNGDIITFKFTATGADPRYITIVTEP